MTFKIATWNVNSLRVRLPHVLAWIGDVQPDVLALQEIKVPDAEFPFDAFVDAGYTAVFAGQRTYNGVAILSRKKPTEVINDFPNFHDPQRRILAITLGQLRILNLYVPNGENVLSEKYQYKLAWLNELNRFLQSESKSYSQLIVLGDFNIAPQEIDVHDPKRWEGQVLFSQKERDAFHKILEVGFEDCYRKYSPSAQKFTWWDYRLNAYKRNLGLRIDHILANKPLSSLCKKCYIDEAPRAWERPSDHAPVIAEFNL
ncbi:MAG: exodeoxyribonuclease III [Gammaproteobacteria bacterium RIFCSPHIGHO2_12_FULL_38_14]|nr:MAG: exodeoxyribonuclease III [Gammaproteobacteria bacterium RIFCSPHIGHO2_12_FULL_38_14]